MVWSSLAQDQLHLPLFSKRSRIRKLWELVEMQQSREQLTKICGEVMLHNIPLRTGGANLNNYYCPVIIQCPPQA